MAGSDQVDEVAIPISIGIVPNDQFEEKGWQSFFEHLAGHPPVGSVDADSLEDA